jgi:hemolysin activation/secretion protein
LSYDNLWQRGHSVSLNYQVSPQDFDQVQAISGSYLLNPLWNRDHYLTFYGVLSDSDVATVGGTQTVGKGVIFGGRYIIPLWPYNNYYHNLTVGVDYKDFDEDIGLAEAEDFSTPVSYVPISFNYAGARPDSSGLTEVRAAVNLSLRGLADQDEFEEKRFNARANYIYLQAGFERTQTFSKWELFGGLDGQISDNPLISNEQYLAGGMDSVRGYKQAEVSGDNAFHWTFELRSPDLGPAFKLENTLTFIGYGFYEGAWVDIIDRLPLEEESQTIQGTGLGFRGTFRNRLSYRLDWGVALEETDRTESGDSRVYFDLTYTF